MVVAFTGKMCGVANDQAPCRCPRRLPAAVATQRVQRGLVVFSGGDGPSYEEALVQARAVEGDLRALAAQRATPSFVCPKDLAARVAEIVELRVGN
ncbi:MAG: hypothetical protein JKY37_07135 [Nannocystaceae bacterium]|nr:hypothetical protein [Nannocystaceae bacterium]